MAAGPPPPRNKNGPLSGGLGVFLVIVLLGTSTYLIFRTLTTAEPPTPEPLDAVFMCTETNTTFPYAMKQGEQWPVVSPYSNRHTGFPAESCYWIMEGNEWKRKRTPTYVVLNAHLGKSGDTLCPDCGRIVIGHNPLPPMDVPPATAPTTAPTGGPPSP